ncbi:hypothetical protein NECAME_01931, partial [Necator americanus]
IEARSLLNVPEKQWKLFSVLVYVHIVLSICLCVSSFAGLIAVRALHMSWPPLIHVVTLFLAIWSLTVITVVSCADANDWYSQAFGTPEPIPSGIKFTNWAKIFADIDVVITVVAALS